MQSWPCCKGKCVQGKGGEGDADGGDGGADSTRGSAASVGRLVVSANAVKAHHKQRTPTVNPQKNAKYTARGGAVELVELEAVENVMATHLSVVVVVTEATHSREAGRSCSSKHRNDATGAHYYHHAEMGTTEWTMPKAWREHE